jgi:hypothetical protein
MKLSSSTFVIISSLGLSLLSACSSETQVNNSPSVINSSPSTVTSPVANKEEHGKSNSGGQVVESDPYHLEFVSEKADNGTHLDLYLQKGDNHEAIPNGKVTAQIQLPDGKQQSLNLPYDAKGKHYAALLPIKTSGQYQVKISADIKGEKATGRFSFDR